MSAYTRMSERGQVVVPKAIRDLKGWLTGTDLEVVDVDDGVLLRPRRSEKRLTVAEATARLPALYTHAGPPVSLDEMNEAAASAAADRYRNGS